VESGKIEASAYLLFDCDAVVDVEALVCELSNRKQRIEYPAAIAFNEFLMDSVESVHEGGAGYFGAFGWRNVLAGPTGRLWLFGLGNNFPARNADGMASSQGVMQAPELLLGAPPSTASDVYLLHQALRSMLPNVSLLPMYETALQRSGHGEAIYTALVSTTAAALAPEPWARLATVAELRSRYRAVRALVPEMPDADEEGLAALITDLLRPVVETARRVTLEVDVAKRTLTLGEDVIDLSSRGPQWRILSELIEGQERGLGISIEAIANAGWPDEKVLPEAARARVYVAISALRKTALRDYIQRRDDGYLMSADVRILKK
jgi:hypothetical protein